MAKGFILVAVPERCSMCRYMYRTDEDYCFCRVEGYGFDYQVNEYMQSTPKGKPDWCPIRELPKRRVGYLFSSDHKDNYKHGWNACIDYMEGK